MAYALSTIVWLIDVDDSQEVIAKIDLEQLLAVGVWSYGNQLPDEPFGNTEITFPKAKSAG